jgi:hypothetical protein
MPGFELLVNNFGSKRGRSHGYGYTSAPAQHVLEGQLLIAGNQICRASPALYM